MNRRVPWIMLVVVVVAGAGAGTGRADDEAEVAIAGILDDFHDAASKADAARYFGHLTDDAVFLGTDATERWPKIDFEAFARPYFDKGTGWTYRTTQRNVSVESDGTRAFFDELLANRSYGTCRGSGVLRKDGGRWRIAQYNLSIPMPNALAKEFVGRIRAHGKGLEVVRTLYLVRHAETQGDAKDRPLNEIGRARARRLAAMLRSAGIVRFIASKYRRTLQTIQPTAEVCGGEVAQDARAIGDVAAEWRDGQDRAVLIAGHSNTVPEFLRELGLGEEIAIAEDDHDNLFVVTLPVGGRPTLRRMHIP